ncbi:hypothetical protein RDI58_006170 [Solanum bulbocastanum]|uniref:Uncharacterized protein n=1 Tax=Solanum bulbocastanum TaxID=147425 RepID=A0AAN8UAF3_SOLBU
MGEAVDIGGAIFRTMLNLLSSQRTWQIRMKILDLFDAGTDSSSSVVEWAMTELLKAPEIMKRVQAELVQVLGEGNAMEEADDSKLDVRGQDFELRPFGAGRRICLITMDYYYCYSTPLALLLAWTLVQGFNLLLVALTTNRSRKFPSGPFPLPIIGNLHLLGNQPHKSPAKLADFHSKIMRLKLGQITTVVISSSDMAKQVLQKQDLAFFSRSIPDIVQEDNFHMFSFGWLPASQTSSSQSCPTSPLKS